jgi:hypothetical protein
MLNEIKWWCKLLNIPYTNDNTLEIWEIKKRSFIRKDIDQNNININNENNNQQLTIFDFEAQAAI